ncbi:MAG: transposase [Patescibacteria group bacterium]
MSSKPRHINTNLYYHVFNCGVEKRTVYLSRYDYNRFLETLSYYTRDQRLGYAHFLLLKPEDKSLYILANEITQERSARVKIIAYCLMPNHFHLLIKPVRSEGVAAFVADVSNSYTRYFNLKYNRIGSLLQGTFKATEVDSGESFLQVSRYIHLNPIRSYYTNPDGKIRKPEDYPYSSYSEWVQPENNSLCDGPEIGKILGTSPKRENSYREFVEGSLHKNPAIGIESFLFEV